LKPTLISLNYYNSTGANTTTTLDNFFLKEGCNWGGGWGGAAQAAESKGQQREQPNKYLKETNLFSAVSRSQIIETTENLTNNRDF